MHLPKNGYDSASCEDVFWKFQFGAKNDIGLMDDIPTENKQTSPQKLTEISQIFHT